MSMYWGYRCLDCFEADREADSPLWMNHGERELRRIAEVRQQLKTLRDTYRGGYLDLGWLGGYDYPLPPTWLIDHADHRIVLINEYEDMEDVDQEDE